MVKSLLLLKYLRCGTPFRPCAKSAIIPLFTVGHQNYSQAHYHNVLADKNFCRGNESYNKRFLGCEFRDGLNSQYTRSFSTSDAKYSFRDRVADYYIRKQKRMIRWNELKEKYNMAAVVNMAPKECQPYLRLARVDKPIGTWLLYLPCAFSISLATPFGELPSLYYLGLFGLGAFLMRGAGCVINDLWDRDLDKNVDRTKDRPIAAGQVSPRNAILLLAGQLTLSLGILLSLNSTCIAIGIASMVPVLIYPLMKRITYFPQVVLGLTFNIGAVMGYTAVTGNWNLAIQIPLYIGCCMWTIFYDTIYALQDMTDDEKTGIKSTALLFYKRNTPEEMTGLTTVERLEEQEKPTQALEKYLLAFFSVAVISWSISMAMKDVDGPAYMTVLLIIFRYLEKAKGFNPLSRNACWERFVDNKIIGLLLLTGIVGGIFIMKPRHGKKRKSQLALQ